MIEWKPVKDYEGIYEVSDQGEVRRIKGGKGTRVGTCLKPKTSNRGYQEVCLCRSTKKKMHLVHRLVATAFFGDSDLQVNHKNFDKTDNRLSNLEWVTPEENMAHAIDGGHYRWANAA
jgi:hypothetical protein